MNYLGIDFGTKTIGLAVSIRGIISPLEPIKNNSETFTVIKRHISQYQISLVYIGLSEGKMATLTLEFVNKLKTMIELPVETVEEAVSTIEASSVFFNNQRKKKDFRKKIDSLAAAVILRRVIN